MTANAQPWTEETVLSDTAAAQAYQIPWIEAEGLPFLDGAVASFRPRWCDFYSVKTHRTASKLASRSYFVRSGGSSKEVILDPKLPRLALVTVCRSQFEYDCYSLESFFLGFSFGPDFNWYEVRHVIARFMNCEWPLRMDRISSLIVLVVQFDRPHPFHL